MGDFIKILVITELEKFSFWKPDLIPRLHLLKPNTLSAMVTIMVVTMVVVGKG